MAVYRFLLAALDKPTPGQHAWFAGQKFRLTLERLGEEFGVARPTGELAAEDAAAHEARYLACFEVGVPQPPVPLLASHYNHREPVPHTIHEHVLFYKRFGVRPAADNIEPADHLLSELAFLIRLDEMFLAPFPEAASVLRGRRDFLKRQAAGWPARAAAVAGEKQVPEVYQILLAILAAAVEQDRVLTETAVAGLSEGQP
jgi:TorA maturation chaperone TorD